MTTSRAPIAASMLLIIALLIPQWLHGEIQVQVQEARAWNFEKSGVRFSNQFPGARLNDCTQAGEREYQLLIRPENTPINNSAWYAFEVSATEPQSISVTLTYEHGRHRYRPKISDDGLTWTDLDPQSWSYHREKNEAVLQLKIGPQPIRVAGQEMIGSKQLRGWMTEMAQKTFIRQDTIGRSLLDQPIEALAIGSPEAANYVFIIGGQHPPEATGSLGLIQFVERLSAHSPLANDYRRHFQTIVIPLINPDGLDHGHWRHNMAGVDLNRDWVGFAQPETRAVRDWLTRLAAQENARPFLLLDFHSTKSDVFYTQKDEHPTFPENFTANWLEAIQESLPDYPLRRSGSHGANHLTSKRWGYATFGVPSITYEFGDNTDRTLIRQVAAVSSDEMMRLMLAEVKGRQPTPPVLTRP